MIDGWRWREIRNAWFGAALFEVFLAWLAFALIPNVRLWPSDADLLDPDTLIAALHASSTLRETTWPIIGLFSLLVVPLTVLRITSVWIKAHSPPLKPLPSWLHSRVGLVVSWLICLTAVMILTAGAGATGGPMTRCMRAMPLIIVFIGYLLYAKVHPRQPLME